MQRHYLDTIARHDCPACLAGMPSSHGYAQYAPSNDGGWAGPWPDDEQEDTGAEA